MPSLIKYGMAPDDDERLRAHFAKQGDPDLRDWRIVDRWDGPDSWNLERFYNEGPGAFAGDLPIALSEYERLNPTSDPPFGGAAYQEWVEKEGRRVPLKVWFRQLYAKEEKGSTTGSDRQVLQRIEEELGPLLRGLVTRYEERKAFVIRSEAREERERKAREESERGD